MSSFYVRRTHRIHPLRPHVAHAEPIDGDAAAIVRPYLAEQERADQAADDTPCWIGEMPAGRTS